MLIDNMWSVYYFAYHLHLVFEQSTSEWIFLLPILWNSNKIFYSVLKDIKKNISVIEWKQKITQTGYKKNNSIPWK